MTQWNVDESPFAVPEGYRVAYRFFLLPVRVAGRYRWCEHVRILQRYMRMPECICLKDYYDVGFVDEILPTPKPGGVDGY